MKFKKGAMFGLDARISLAIFGALSVISGAALYSAIQDAKITSLITQMQEVAKAYEQYVLDKGSEATMHDVFARKTNVLVKNEESESTWNGPYIGIEDVGHSGSDPVDRINKTDGKKIFVICAPSTTFGGPSATSGRLNCSSGLANHNWVLFETYEKSIADAVDLKVDGEVDHRNGNIRVIEWNSTSYSIYYKLIPALDFK
jgi:type II secretory pathway pseudopilin PulG